MIKLTSIIDDSLKMSSRMIQKSSLSLYFTAAISREDNLEASRSPGSLSDQASKMSLVKNLLLSKLVDSKELSKFTTKMKKKSLIVKSKSF